MKPLLSISIVMLSLGLCLPDVIMPSATAANRVLGKTVKAGMGVGQGVWHNYTVPDGLPYSVIYALALDRQGDLWIGTKEGACRYNGTEFITFTTDDGLASNVVRSILVDKTDHLWFGTGTWAGDYGAGVSYYNGERFFTFTTDDGLVDNTILAMTQDRLGNIWFGTAQGISKYDGKTFKTLRNPEGLELNKIWSIMEDLDGNIWFGTQDFGVIRYDGEHFDIFTTQDGLADNTVLAIDQDSLGNMWFGTAKGISQYDGQVFRILRDEQGPKQSAVWSISRDQNGHMWFGTYGQGVSRYDGDQFATLTTEDGLAHNWALSIQEDKEANLWFGTLGGLSRYDGIHLTNFTTEDGLSENRVMDIFEDKQGFLWLSTWGGGVNRFDRKQFSSFTTEDNLIHNQISCGLEDKKGYLWFGTQNGGINLYDGFQFTTIASGHDEESTVLDMFMDQRDHIWVSTGSLRTNEGQGLRWYTDETLRTFTTETGLVNDQVRAITEDNQGHLWFGTVDGINHYDGEKFTAITTKDGLISNDIRDLYVDSKDHLWIATTRNGVSRFDGKQIVSFTTEDGLPSNSVDCLMEDKQGHMWFGTWGGGVCQYDGLVFQTLLERDGLGHNQIADIFQDRSGDIWLGTEGGLTLYKPNSTPPPIYLTNIRADLSYGPVDRLSLPSSQNFVVFEFRGRSFKTRQMVYVYQLEGYDKSWRQTREQSVEYTNLPRGDYIFRVKAVDRDLTYSDKPVIVYLNIQLPYQQIALISGFALAILMACIASGYAFKRHRDLRQAEQIHMQELEEELQTAHDMQMRLMPLVSPDIPRLDIAGQCLPANHVGGDFFQYFLLSENRLAISLADVTGHAMEAAIPVVMFSGILNNEMENKNSLEDLFTKLNRSMYRNLDSRTFVCFSMAEMDVETGFVKLINSGCPYPYHYKFAMGTIEELQLDDYYPLGIRSDSEYASVEILFEPGDYLVYCSDGIIESENHLNEIFGFERTQETIRQACCLGLSSSEIIDHLIESLQAFTGDKLQSDDMTCVVARLE